MYSLVGLYVVVGLLFFARELYYERRNILHDVLTGGTFRALCWVVILFVLSLTIWPLAQLVTGGKPYTGE
jgi:hypothetical protein